MNLSFNKIQYLNGLNDLGGRDYNLETLLLHGNQINSIEECKIHLSSINKLKHLSLNDNPIARIKSKVPFIHQDSLFKLNFYLRLPKCYSNDTKAINKLGFSKSIKCSS